MRLDPYTPIPTPKQFLGKETFFKLDKKIAAPAEFLHCAEVLQGYVRQIFRSNASRPRTAFVSASTKTPQENPTGFSPKMGWCGFLRVIPPVFRTDVPPFCRRQRALRAKCGSTPVRYPTTPTFPGAV